MAYKKFTFIHHESHQLSSWQHLLTWLISLPANGILFIGITALLGFISLWVASSVITPQNNQQPEVIIFLNNNQSTLSSAAVIIGSIIVSLGLLVIAAEATRRTTRWLAKKLNVVKYYALFEVSLVCLGWLPLATLLARYDTQYGPQLALTAGIIIVICAVLFIFEDLLIRFWQKST